MANTLDLQEQEQIDELKAFWARWGNVITWTLTLVLCAFAAWNGWNWWQREQAAKAAGLYDELDKAAVTADVERAGRLFADLKDRYAGTTQAAQGALLTASLQADKGQAEAARTTLAWLADKGDDQYRTIARLRLAGLLIAEAKHDEAAKVLDAATDPAFAALVADRRGDLAMARGQRDEAVKAWQTAWAGMPAALDYRNLFEAKLTAAGAAPGAAAAVAAGAAASSAAGSAK
jgi:predicted negative regulator of RcsB-dependent stress response